MMNSVVNDFGVVDPLDDYYELRWGNRQGRQVLSYGDRADRARAAQDEILLRFQQLCGERVSERVVRELAEGMGDTERSKKAPILKRGVNRMSPLIGRELATLFWAFDGRR